MTRTLLALALTSLLASAAAAAEEVARAAFTLGIQDREPIDEVTWVDASTARVHFYTELRDLNGQRVTHRWLHEGQVMAEVGFDVAGERWRVWSNKRLLPIWTGAWTVEVLAEDGRSLGSWDLEVRPVEPLDPEP